MVGRRIGLIVAAVALIGIIGALVETIVGRCTAVAAEMGFCAGTTLLVGFFVRRLIRESRALSLNEGATTPGISWQHTPTNLLIKSYVTTRYTVAAKSIRTPAVSPSDSSFLSHNSAKNGFKN